MENNKKIVLSKSKCIICIAITFILASHSTYYKYMEIAKGIEARLEGVKVTPTEIMKNNGVIQNGVSFRKDDKKSHLYCI